jgi:hypothetical protein
VRTAALTALATLIVTAVSYAAAPVKGARYSGAMTGPKGWSLNFKVAKDGKSLSSLRLMVVPNDCAYGGAPPRQTASMPRISKGEFATTVRYRTTKGAVYATTRVRGEFLKGGRARGVLMTKFKDAEAKMCNGRFEFTARAR